MNHIGQEQALRIVNVPGAEDYQFDWAMRVGKLFYQRKPDGPRQELAGGVGDQNLALALVHMFGAGMAEAARVRMCPWPPPEAS